MRSDASSPGSVTKPIAPRASTESFPSSSHLPTVACPTPLDSALNKLLKSALSGFSNAETGFFALSLGVAFLIKYLVMLQAADIELGLLHCGFGQSCRTR